METENITQWCIHVFFIIIVDKCIILLFGFMTQAWQMWMGWVGFGFYIFFGSLFLCILWEVLTLFKKRSVLVGKETFTCGHPLLIYSMCRYTVYTEGGAFITAHSRVSSRSRSAFHRNWSNYFNGKPGLFHYRANDTQTSIINSLRSYCGFSWIT